MIKGFIVFTVFLCSFLAQANVFNPALFLRTEAVRMTMQAIDWKVGDSQDLQVQISMGLEGTMHKEATREEGNAIWMLEQLTLPIMNDKTEVLIDRNSGKILKYVHNDKEEPVPNSEIEIVETKNDVVEVPAGKFKVLYVKAKTKDVPLIEMWANPREIALDGSAKLHMNQQSVDITMSLTKFNKHR